MLDWLRINHQSVLVYVCCKFEESPDARIAWIAFQTAEIQTESLRGGRLAFERPLRRRVNALLDAGPSIERSQNSCRWTAVDGSPADDRESRSDDGKSATT